MLYGACKLGLSLTPHGGQENLTTANPCTASAPTFEVKTQTASRVLWSVPCFRDGILFPHLAQRDWTPSGERPTIRCLYSSLRAHPWDLLGYRITDKSFTR